MRTKGWFRLAAAVTAIYLSFSCLPGQLWAAGQKDQQPAGEAALKKMTLRMGLISAEGHPVTKASKMFSELVGKRTDGAITIEVFPGGSLGGEVELQDMVSEGTLDLASLGNGIPPNYNAQFQLLQMPFLWDDQDQMIAFANSEIQEEMNRKYLEASKVRILASNWDQGVRHTISKKAINRVEDFQGLKIRVPQLPAWVDMWKTIGTNPAPIPFPEVYTALQQGVVDGMECPLYWIYSSSFHEQAKYLILTAHIMYYNQVFINDKLFQSLPKNVQEIMKKAALEAGEFETKLTREEESGLRKKLEDAGTVFLEVDRKKISEMMKPVYEKWKDKYGEDILAKVNKFKASYTKK